MNLEAGSAFVLEHYGVKGQKWGVRKSRTANIKRAGTARTRFSKSPNRLTTRELTNRIKRMETEKRYNQLNRRDLSEGQQFVKDVLTNSGRRVATTVLTGSTLVAIKAVLSSKLGSSIATEATRRIR